MDTIMAFATFTEDSKPYAWKISRNTNRKSLIQGASRPYWPSDNIEVLAQLVKTQTFIVDDLRPSEAWDEARDWLRSLGQFSCGYQP